MTLVQRVKAKLKRSESEVTAICISPEASNNKVIQISPSMSAGASSQAKEAFYEDLMKAHKEISALKHKEKETKELILEKDKHILELEELLSRVKNERLKEENTSYQESLKATKQFIEGLEKEVELLTSQIKEMKEKSDAKLQRIKRRHIQSKQDSALKIFELKEQNLLLSAEIQKIRVEQEYNIATPNSKKEADDKYLNTDKKFCSCGGNGHSMRSNEREPKSQLILQLSEKIESLEDENKRLADENKRLISSLNNLKIRSSNVTSDYDPPP